MLRTLFSSIDELLAKFNHGFLVIAKATRGLHRLHAAFEHVLDGFRGTSELNNAIVSGMTKLEREALESAFASDISSQRRTPGRLRI